MEAQPQPALDIETSTPIVGPQYQATRDQIDKQLATYGSIERWPTLSLLPEQFSLCACGHTRGKHRMVGTERVGCYASKKCTCDKFCSVAIAPSKKG